MRFYRLFTRLAFIGLLLPTGAAWGGGGNTEYTTESLRQERECSLKHVCEGGDRAGLECPVVLQDLLSDPRGVDTCEPPNVASACPRGRCVVKYVTDINPNIIPGTLTVIADSLPPSQPGESCSALTVSLKIKEDAEIRFLAMTNLIQSQFGSGLDLSIRVAGGGGTLEGIQYRRLDYFADSLIAYSGLDKQKLVGAVPVIASVEKTPILSGGTANEFLAVAAMSKVGIRFAYPSVVTSVPEEDIAGRCRAVTTSSVRGDLDGDEDVDQDDVNILLLDNNQSPSRSGCGLACDLNGDHFISVLDARKLTLLCTRPRCATK